MRKKILLLGISALLCGIQYSFARDANPVKVKYYQADGVTIYDVRGCVPASDIAFYSERSGGAMLKEVPVNANGETKLIWDQKMLPAFVLNVWSPNASGIAGNAMVSFTGDEEFAVNDMALDNKGGVVTLRWNASVTTPQNYSFEVLKSVNGVEYTVIQSINAQSSSTIPYSFNDAAQANATATYQIRVISADKEVYYTSSPLYADGSNGVSVYPTIAHNSINIVQHNNQGSIYRILDMQGQVMTSGILANAQNNCSVSNFPPGNYLIEISGAGKNTVTKFVKE